MRACLLLRTAHTCVYSSLHFIPRHLHLESDIRYDTVHNYIYVILCIRLQYTLQQRMETERRGCQQPHFVAMWPRVRFCNVGPYSTMSKRSTTLPVWYAAHVHCAHTARSRFPCAPPLWYSPTTTSVSSGAWHITTPLRTKSCSPSAAMAS